MEEPAPQVDGRLAVREEESAFVVFRAGDPEDWLACFEKTEGFPAREWAENKARVCNRRLEKVPPGRPPRPEHVQPATIRAITISMIPAT